MATSTPLTQTAAPNLLSPSRNPIVLWHLLSLDAPSVAALWTWFLARENHVRLPATSVLAMAVAVWMLYVADRLLDSRSIRPKQELEERHFFHRANRRAFTSGLIFAALALAALVPHLYPESLRLYLILGAVLFAYFLLIHSAATSRRLPKEIAVGVFFSAASFVPTVAQNPGLRLTLFPAAVLFAVLCSLNCLFIYTWEHPFGSRSNHPATRIALQFLTTIALASVVAGITLAFASPRLPWQIPAASAVSSTLLLLLHRSRARFNPITLRAAADLCLLTPLMLLPLIQK